MRKGNLNRPHLCVEPPNVEEHRSSLKGHSLLSAWNPRERVVPELDSLMIPAGNC